MIDLARLARTVVAELVIGVVFVIGYAIGQREDADRTARRAATWEEFASRLDGWSGDDDDEDDSS